MRPADRDTFPRAPSGPVLASVSNAIVGIHRSHCGRGPTRAKSHVLDDVLICVLSDVLTPAERTLVEAGQRESVRAARFELGRALEELFRAAVEENLGRRVIGFTSQLLVDPGIAIEVFLLEPEEG